MHSQPFVFHVHHFLWEYVMNAHVMWNQTRFSAAIGDRGESGDREPVQRAAGGGGEGQEGGDGDPGGRAQAGDEAGWGYPGSPGAEVHGAEEEPGADGEALQKQEWCGLLTGNTTRSNRSESPLLSLCIQYGLYSTSGGKLVLSLLVQDPPSRILHGHHWHSSKPDCLNYQDI